MRSPLLSLLLCLALLCIGAASAGAASAVFDVTTYGAVGDGKTDDSAAVYKAAEAMQAQAEGAVGTLYFPAGTFLLTTPAEGALGDAFVDFTVEGQWTVTGAGAEQTIISWNSQTGQLLNVDVRAAREARGAAAPSEGPTTAAGTSFTLANFTVQQQPVPTDWKAQYNGFNLQDAGDVVTISNMRFESDPRAASVAYYVVRAGDMTVRNVTSTKAIQAFSIQSCTNVILSDVSVLGESGARFQPLGVELVDAGSSILLERMEISNANQGFVVMLYPFLHQGDITDVRLVDSKFSDCAVGAEISTNVTLVIEDSSFEATSLGTNATGIQLDDFAYSAAQVSVRGCTFSNLGAGIVQVGGRVTVANSTLQDVAHGFDYQASSSPSPAGFATRPFSVSGTRFAQAAGAEPQMALHASAGAGFVVQGNTCAGPTTPMQLDCTGGGCTVSNNPGC